MARTTIFSGKRLRHALMGAGAIALASCAVSEPPPGASDAPTIVSLNPCLDAILVEVAAPSQILALSHYSRDPSASSMDVDRAREFGVTEGTVEEILALQPDIVLVGTFMAPATRNALDRLGVRVETFGSPVSVEESMAQVRELSALTGGKAAGEALAGRIGQALADPVAGPEISTLMWQPGQIVPGDTTLVSEMLGRSGFVSHSAARGLAQGDYVALETVLAEPPELLLVAGSSAGQRHPMLDRMQTTHVETLEPNLLYCGGPTIIALRERLDAVREAIERRNAVPLDGPQQAMLQRRPQ